MSEDRGQGQVDETTGATLVEEGVTSSGKPWKLWRRPVERLTVRARWELLRAGVRRIWINVPGVRFHVLWVAELLRRRRWRVRQNAVTGTVRAVAIQVEGARFRSEPELQELLLVAGRSLARARLGWRAVELHQVHLELGWKARRGDRIQPVAQMSWNRWTAAKITLASEDSRERQGRAVEDKIHILVAPDTWPGRANVKCDPAGGGCGQTFHFGPLKCRAFGENHSWWTKCPHCRTVHTVLVTTPTIRQLQKPLREEWSKTGAMSQAGLRKLVVAVDQLMGRDTTAAQRQGDPPA